MRLAQNKYGLCGNSAQTLVRTSQSEMTGSQSTSKLERVSPTQWACHLCSFTFLLSHLGLKRSCRQWLTVVLGPEVGTKMCFLVQKQLLRRKFASLEVRAVWGKTEATMWADLTRRPQLPKEAIWSEGQVNWASVPHLPLQCSVSKGKLNNLLCLFTQL